MAETNPTWLYKLDDARVFELAPGEALPEGWHDSPAKCCNPAAADPFDHDGDGKVGGSKPKRHPFDHDGDGKPGGSLPKAKRPRR